MTSEVHFFVCHRPALQSPTTVENRFMVPKKEREQARVVIAEHQAAVRSALKGFVQGQLGLEVVGASANGLELLALTVATCPDLVLLDWDLPGGPGVDLILALRLPDCQPRVIVLGVRPEAARAALDAGADAFVYKGEQPKFLLNTIYSVLIGGQD